MTGPRCCRCPRPATHAVAVEAGVLRLCRRHAEQVAEAVNLDPVVVVGRRRARLDAPVLDGGRR